MNSSRKKPSRAPSSAAPPAWGAETRYFYDLTPERILEAVEATGLRCTGRVHPLNSMENRVFALELETPLPGTSTGYVVAKFYRPGRWTREQIQCEHDFLRDLAEAEIPSVCPLAHGGATVLTMPETGLFYSIFPRVGGRTPDELDEEMLLRVGRLLGRMHAVGARRAAPARVKLNAQTYGYASLDFLHHCGMPPAPLLDRIDRAARPILERAAPWLEEARVQRIHGDAHLGNLLFTPQGPLWVDFDDMVMGPPLQDLWLLTAGRDEESRHRRELMLQGYGEFMDFDYSSLRLIEPLRALRHLHFAAWVAKRWEDPAFPRAFPEFNTPGTWARLAEDLQECLEVMESA